MDKKISVVVVAVCSAAPPKARRSRASKKEKAKSCAGDTSSVVRPGNTKSLESSKRKRKDSEDIFDAEIQAASSLAQLSRKKSKKAMKKVVVAVVQCAPPTFSDDEMIDEPLQTGFSSCLWCDLRFGVHHDYTPNSENGFVDIETFSDTVLETRSVPFEPSTVAFVDVGTSKTVVADEEASLKFTEELERTVSQSGILLEDPSLVETREAIPDE
jgi:hypothetical protein